LVRK